MNVSEFWLVWCDNGGAPTVKHPTEEHAKAEAQRLAVANPGRVFHVMCVAASCVKDAVSWLPIDRFPPF